MIPKNNKKDRERDEEYYSKLREVIDRTRIVDPPLKPDIDSKGLLERLKKNLGTIKKFRLILSRNPGLFETEEDREKRLAAQKLKAKKIRRYLYVALIIIGAILVILIG
ncbi:hypothetical protein [Prochlorococcus sp. MIT 1223]|uniref:hypothetical protein n=1 Tax=Prochlorococcus sp. MIT 1223 TaxID=3096217 RepID=UPI002A757385|nr:hypothetical protein [Prochlorococcus sp. MIT 1223]